MAAATVRISATGHKVLKELAEQTGQPMTDLLDKALDAYRRKLFLDQTNAGYAALRADSQAWGEHVAERRQWDVTLADGLEADECWTDDGRCRNPEDGKPDTSHG